MSTSLLIPNAGGACFNPARALGPAFAAGDFKDKWVYVLAPMVAAIVQSSVYRIAPYKTR